VKDGDEIAIDVVLRTVDLNVDAAELAARSRLAGPWKVAEEKGWLSIYAQTVQPLSRGAVLFRKSPNQP
jgi:dihydroxy-acid dehydratase